MIDESSDFCYDTLFYIDRVVYVPPLSWSHTNTDQNYSD